MTRNSGPKARAIALNARQGQQRTLLWAWLVAGLLVLTALAWALPASAAGKVLVRGNAAEPNSLDPHRATGVWENNIIGDLLMGLYTDDNNAKAILGAAESAETSPDGLTWTFKIRPHTWSDGVPVKASDFVFALRRILNPTFAAEYANVLYPIKNAEAVNKGRLPVEQLGVIAQDDKTLIMQLEHPAPWLPELLTHYTTFPLPQHAVEKHGDKWTRAGNYVSNGAYTLVEWSKDNRVVTRKNPLFWDAANVKIDEVIFFPTQDDVAAMKRYRAGELDLHERWPITELKWLQDNIPNEARKYTALQVSYIVFNTTRKPLDDIRLRKALSLAYDRERVATEIFGGAFGQPAYSFLPPGLPNADNTARVYFEKMSMAERMAEAQKLMTELGHGPANPLRLKYNIGNNNDAKRIAVTLQAMWKQIGVEIEIISQDTAVHYKTLQTKDFDIGAAGWVWDYGDAKNLLFLFLSTTTAQNYCGYNNPAFDALSRDADLEPDNAKRAAMLGKMNEMLLTDLCSLPTFFPYQRKLVKSYVMNFTDNPRDINRTRWLDLAPGAQTAAGNNPGAQTGTQATEGDFWTWLGSWFSWDAWSKWWNS